MHDIDDNYSSEELISDNTDSGEEDNPRPIYVMYRSEDVRKEFQFKADMEFKSLKEFKAAIQEHSALNGKEVKWEKMIRLE